MVIYVTLPRKGLLEDIFPDVPECHQDLTQGCSPSVLCFGGLLKLFVAAGYSSDMLKVHRVLH